MNITDEMIEAALAAWDSIPKHKDLDGRKRMRAALAAAAWKMLTKHTTSDGVRIGDQVVKIKGYKWPGEVRSIFTTIKKETRVVVECTVPEVAGALHIYNLEQIEKVAND